MHFPTLSPRPRYQQTVDAFGGYNHQLRIGENEFYDMENCCADLWPVVAPRKKRGLYAENVTVQGMIAKDSLCYVDGRNFVIGSYAVDLGLSDCPKQLVSMGAYVIILPDKIYFNTADFSDFGPIEAEVTFPDTMVHYFPCKLDGTEYTPDYIQPEAPAEPTNMQLWMDTSRDPHSLRQYSSAMGTWAAVDTTYVKIQAPGIGKAFRQYDGVTITGLENQDNLQLQSVCGNKVLYGVLEDALIIQGLMDVHMLTMNIPLTISRKMPAMDFVIEQDNRLWGCRYGLNNEGAVVNELYACALGDFRNWNRFLGVSTDSYFVSLGSDGPFTGAIAQGGHPLFFKERCLHKVYGQIPANFQVQTTMCRGVQKGCEKSLAIVDEVLYYKSFSGICAYDGSLPVEVSQALGEERYEEAVAAAHGGKYYIHMKNSITGLENLFVFDTAKGLWHKESGVKAKLLCPCREELYCATEDGKILALLGSGEIYEENLHWMLETGILGGSLPEKKYLLKLGIRLNLEPGSHLKLMAQYDSLGSWVDLAHLTGTDLRSFTIPVKPRQCDHLRLRIEGAGPGRILSITKTYTKGSDH